MIRNILRSTKVAAAETLYRSRLLRIMLNRRMTDRVCVLMYHRIINERVASATDSHPGIIVSESHFDRQMQALREFMHPLSLSEFEEHVIHGGEVPDNSCLVTFDDGWLDNYEIALPILKRHEVPAAIFVPVDYISDTRMFWQEEMLMRLTALMNAGDAQSLRSLCQILEVSGSRSRITLGDIRRRVVGFKSLPDGDVSSRLDSLREATQRLRMEHYNRYLNWDQLRELQTAGIGIASHACSHRRLSRLSPEECHAELTRSRALIEDRLGIPVRSIAYPNGDVNDAVISSAKQCGYEVGFGTSGGLFGNHSDRFNIPRINLHDNNSRQTSQFLCTCVGIL